MGAAKRVAGAAEAQLRLQQQQLKAQQDRLLAANMLNAANTQDAVVKTEVGGDSATPQVDDITGTPRKKSKATTIAQSLGIR